MRTKYFVLCLVFLAAYAFAETLTFDVEKVKEEIFIELSKSLKKKIER